MVPHEALQVRFGKQWGLQPQLSKFLVLLLTMECVSEHTVHERIGNVAGSVLAHRLRRTLKGSGFVLTIKCLRGYGYWIADADKRRIAAIPDLHVTVEDGPTDLLRHMIATEVNQRALEYVNTPDEADEKTGIRWPGANILRPGSAE